LKGDTARGLKPIAWHDDTRFGFLHDCSKLMSETLYRKAVPERSSYVLRIRINFVSQSAAIYHELRKTGTRRLARSLVPAAARRFRGADMAESAKGGERSFSVGR
jgi:hypothetical protein